MGVKNELCLFPHGVKLLSGILFVIACMLGIFYYFNIDGEWLANQIGCTIKDTFETNFIEAAYNDFVIIGIIGGAVLLTCSRETDENEAIRMMRLKSLMTAFLINSSLLIIATLVAYELAFLNVMLWNLVSFPVIFVIVYEVNIWRLRRRGKETEGHC